METTEKIVEAYCRYLKGWFTIPNIKCGGQHEIDLLAINPNSRPIKRYHIESGVSISGSFSKLTSKDFSLEKLRQRNFTAQQRRTVGYFHAQKFSSEHVISKLSEYGFKENNYCRIVVTWDYTPEAEAEALRKSIIIWDFREILKEITTTFKTERTYFTDDTLRTLQLLARSQK